MSCYHPNLLQPLGVPLHAAGQNDNPFTQQQKYVFIPNGKASQDMLVNSEAYGLIKIPCGHCLGCRLDYSRMWADRMMLELETEKKGIFVTLTYNDECIPIHESDGRQICYTLDKRDCQLFMKNLRRCYDGHDGRDPIKIRFFAAGEYGPTGTHRPHLHLIVFGLGLEDFPLKVFRGTNELHQAFYQVPELEYCWSEFEGKGKKRKRVRQKGFVTVSEVSWNTCAYVARYVVKKALPNVDGFNPSDHGAIPEFTLQSRRPGIGAAYLKAHPDCLDFQKIAVGTKNGVRMVQVPKYFLRICDLSDAEKCAIFEQRKCGAIDSMLSELSRTSLSYMDQLEVNEERKKGSMKALRRNLA